MIRQFTPGTGLILLSAPSAGVIRFCVVIL
jgi:hypothetical protein